MRFLIVDESSEFRRVLAGMLRARWPQARTDEWDPRQHGNPARTVARERYDLVLLDSHPAGRVGIQWLADMRKDPQAPPVVLVADQGDTHVAIQAMKAGAADFLRKTGLTEQRLTRALEDALREQEARHLESTGVNPVFARTVPLGTHRIGAPVQENAGGIPGYRTLRKIGQGGMAQVYLAERVHDGMQMVLKVLDPALRSDATFLQRFVREYKLIVTIENEHVAHIFDQGFAGDHAYIAMEYLPGGTLVFGLAKDLGSNSELTRLGEFMATPRYMSPEQCMGKDADARSDLYSLGVILYEMLTGRRLWDDEGPAGLVHLHVHGELPLLPERLAGYQTILDRLLAKKPENRFRSAHELFATIAV